MSIWDLMEDFLLISLFILMLVAIVLMVVVVVPVDRSTTDTYYDIYMVAAPFGIIYSDISGNFFFATGSLNTDLSEECVVKYYMGSELKTKSFSLESKNTHIIIGEEFKFRIIEHKKINICGETIKSKYEYYIYLPSLPEVNQTTNDFVRL